MPAELHGHCDQGPERAREDVHTLGEAKQQGLASSWTSSGVRPFWRIHSGKLHPGDHQFWCRQYDSSACSKPTAVVSIPNASKRAAAEKRLDRLGAYLVSFAVESIDFEVQSSADANAIVEILTRIPSTKPTPAARRVSYSYSTLLPLLLSSRYSHTYGTMTLAAGKGYCMFFFPM